jgi:integrase
MSTLRKAAEEYVKVRRRLGFKLVSTGYLLPRFIDFLEQNRASHITSALALRWAKEPTHVIPAEWTRRLSIVRLFAQHRSATDPRTQVPPPNLLPHRYHRHAPYLYPDEEVTRLIDAARKLLPPTGLKRWTYPTLFGLLAVTGLRHSEALALDRDAVDLSVGVLTIRGTKFGKSRLVPLHPSTSRALKEYARQRDRVFSKAPSPAFFVSHRGRRLTQCLVRWTFNRLSRRIGLRGQRDRYGPRLHDLRHRFAVNTLLGWYRAGLDVEQHMPTLSTFLGHTHVADTYWYLSAAPELLGLAGARLENTLGDLP